MRKLASFIPGFRSGRLWKKIIAIIGYIILTFYFISLVLSNQDANVSSNDNIISTWDSIAMIIFILIIPFCLITNFGNIRSKLPLFKNPNVGIKIVAWIVSIIIIFLGWIITFSILDNLHSPEYKALQQQIRKEQSIQEAQEKANKEAERKVKLAKEAEEKAKKAEEIEKKKKEETEKQAMLAAGEESAKEAEEKSELAMTEEEKSYSEEQTHGGLQKNTDSGTESVNAQVLGNETDILDGFVLYEADGFSIQIPKSWHTLGSQLIRSSDVNTSDSLNVDYSAEQEIYRINYRTDNSFDTRITIYPFNKEDYEYFVQSQKDHPDLINKVDIKNADVAFAYTDYKDSISEISRRELIVYKDDVCFILSAYHNAGDKEGGFVDMYRKLIKQYRDDVDKMFSSFELTDETIDFKTITQSETPSQLFSELKDQ